MSAEDAPITEREARMMAYLDDQLDAADRRAFEAELGTNPDLAIEVARFKTVCDLTDSMRMMEPADHEMRRFWAKFYNRGEWRLGWLLVVLGATTLVGFGLWECASTDELPWTVKCGMFAVTIGSALLLINTVRFKLRTHQFDRYRGVLR